MSHPTSSSKGCKLQSTSLKDTRKKILAGKIKPCITAYYDLFPEEWEAQRKKIMKELD